MNNQSKYPHFSRRNLIKYGGGIMGTSLMATVLGSNLIKPKPGISQNDFTPDEALAKLMEGNQRIDNLPHFILRNWKRKAKSTALF